VTDSEHVVGRDLALPAPAAAQVRVEVGDHPPEALVVAVRPDVQRGTQAVPVRPQQPGVQRVVHGKRVQRGPHRRLRFGVAEQEHPDQRAQLARVPGGPPGGLGLAAAERGMRLRAEQVDHTVGVVADGTEGLAQPGADVRGKIREHQEMLARLVPVRAA